VSGPNLSGDTELSARSLRSFIAVAEELNFTRAAARLFVAQQALSRDIAQLERRLGMPLFARTTRRVALTPEGERLLVRARELVALHDELLADIARPSRPLVVDVLSEGRLTGSRMLEALRAAAPELEFRGRHTGGTGLGLRLLRAAEIDIVLGRIEWRGQGSLPGIEHRPVRYEPLAALLPRGHRLAEGRDLPLTRLKGEVIDTNPAHPEALEWIDLTAQFVELADAVATPPHLPAVGLDEQTHHLIRQGLPILTSLDHIEVPGGVVRPLVQPVPVFTWSVAWRAGLHRAAVDAIESAIETLAVAEDWLALPDDAWLPEPERSRLAGRSMPVIGPSSAHRDPVIPSRHGIAPARPRRRR
jgi:DNA-binding transcriptional LysR family regulator